MLNISNAIGNHKAHRKAKNKLKPFAFLPRELVTHPPIESTPFEVSVCVGSLRAAWEVWSQTMHRVSLQYGHESIKIENELADDFRKQTDAYASRKKNRRDKFPVRIYTYDRMGQPTHKPIKRSQALVKAGSIGYQMHRDTMLREGPKSIKVELSRCRLLTLSGLSADGKNMAKLDATLDQLGKPVGKLCSPLLSWCISKSGRLRIELEGTWLTPPFVRVPIPLPLKSTTALSIYLFVHGIKTGPINRKGMSLSALCQRLGVRRDRFAQRALDRALDIIDKHLAGLPMKELIKQGIKLAGGYRIKVIEENKYLRFEALPYHYHDDDPVPVQRKQSKRQRDRDRQAKKDAYQEELRLKLAEKNEAEAKRKAAARRLAEEQQEHERRQPQGDGSILL